VKIEQECEECGALCLDDDGNLTPVAHDLIEQQAAALEAANAQIAELSKDAERYRWLRDSNNFVDGGIIVGNAEGEEILWDESLDRAIDAAIAASAEKEESIRAC
jgi:hypothetical protein